jgi:hypothetical protein
MISECTVHSILVTTNNCNTLTILYDLKVTTATYICYVLTSLCLVMAFGNGEYACCVSRSFRAGLPLASVNTTLSSAYNKYLMSDRLLYAASSPVATQR